MKPITFGTDGWRGIMSDDFTYANIACVTEAIAIYLRNHGHAGAPVVVGYDTRFNSDNFAAFVAYLLAKEGIKPLVAASFVPTPVTAFAVQHLKTAGAIMFTASHNAPVYNGIKFIPEYAGPALTDVTDEITANIAELVKKG
jgi:phosphomannomutase